MLGYEHLDTTDVLSKYEAKGIDAESALYEIGKRANQMATIECEFCGKTEAYSNFEYLRDSEWRPSHPFPKYGVCPECTKFGASPAAIAEGEYVNGFWTPEDEYWCEVCDEIVVKKQDTTTGAFYRVGGHTRNGDYHTIEFAVCSRCRLEPVGTPV